MEASQSEVNSQSTNQNSLCVSGESTSLSCNNLASDSIGLSIPGEQGPAGPQGPQGEQGPKGPIGATGATGPQGIQGEKGDTGSAGPMGSQGPQGPQGPIGPIGPQGPKGETGATGPQEERGLQGDSAPLQHLTMRTVEGDIVRNGFSAGVQSKSVASCDFDEVLTGGGFAHTGNANYIMDFSRPTGNSWEAQGSPMSSDSSFTQAYAQCQKLEPIANENDPVITVTSVHCTDITANERGVAVDAIVSNVFHGTQSLTYQIGIISATGDPVGPPPFHRCYRTSQCARSSRNVYWFEFQIDIRNSCRNIQGLSHHKGPNFFYHVPISRLF